MAARAVAATMVVAVAVLLAVAGGAWGQSSSPSSQCTSALVSLSPCLNYISGNVSTAPPACCTQLGKVVQSDPQCLCVALSADPASLGLTVNRTRALGLPEACNVKTPDVSNCKGAAGAGAGAPATTPAAGQTAPATGSKTTPATSSSVPGAAAAAASPRGSAAVAAAGFVVAAAVAVFAV